MSPARPASLDELFRSGRLRKAGIPSPAQPGGPAPLSTGLPALDEALGGGLARGQLTELIAPPSAGGTALLRAALGAATRRGELCALIDPGDAFDPGGALDNGQPDPSRLDLRRLLWVRPASIALALRAAEIALEARFALVALDLAGPFPERPRRDEPAPHRPLHERAARALQALIAQLPLESSAPHQTMQRIDQDVARLPRPRSPSSPQPGGSPWARLARRAERQGGALFILSRTPQAGAFAGAAVELSRAGPRWSGAPGTPGRLLCGTASVGAVVRCRRARPSGGIALALSTELS